MTTCSIQGCEGNIYARGWCQKHYMRWYIHGSPDTLLKTRQGAPSEFLANAITYKGNECIFWPFAANNKGYPQINLDGAKYLVSRIVCTKSNGPPPTDRHEAAHGCGNGHRGCITPRHLRWATHSENCADTISHGRTTRGELSVQSKLVEADALEIYRCVIAGNLSQQEIADQYGISQTAVSKIKLGKLWDWLTGASS